MKLKLFVIPIICILFLNNQGTQEPATDKKMNSYISDLMSKMTMEEKIGQLNLVAGGDMSTGAAVSENIEQKIRAGEIGSILNIPFEVTQKTQELAVNDSRLHIPIIFGRE